MTNTTGEWFNPPKRWKLEGSSLPFDDWTVRPS